MDIHNNIAKFFKQQLLACWDMRSKSRTSEEDDMTAKLQRSLLELHSSPVTAKAEKSWSRDTKETEGEAISLLLRLINNKFMQECMENSKGAKFGVASRHAELLN